MAESLDALLRSITQLETSPSAVASVAAAATRFALNNADIIVDVVDDALRASPQGPFRLAYWSLVDRLCKAAPLFRNGVQSRILRLVTEAAPRSSDATEWPQFHAILLGFYRIFDPAIVSALRHYLDAATESASTHRQPVTRSSTTDRGKEGAFEKGAVFTKQAATSCSTLADGIFTAPRTVARQEGERSALQVRTRDSYVGLIHATAYVPAVPVEIDASTPMSDADAPEGYRQSPPTASAERQERKRLREILAAQREKFVAHKDREERRARRKSIFRDSTAESTSGEDCSEGESPVEEGGAPRVHAETFDDVVMPEEFPRDECGVRVGYYPQGVRFIRTAIRQCGGALELSVLQHRISTMTDNEAVTAIGDVRAFVTLHTPTFVVSEETGQWVVRVRGDAPLRDSVWAEATCPWCQRTLRRRNLAYHTHSRRCVAVQAALGLEGVHTGPIARLISAAREIVSAASARQNVDDDDITHLASCLQDAGAVSRYKLSSPTNFDPVIRAVHRIREMWLLEKNATTMGEIQITPSDRAMVHFFETLGSLVHRLPIAWIEMGDIIDMCHRFCKGVLPPFDPPPRPADPRIHVTNQFPGMLFCESEVDSDDDAASVEEMSDEEKEPMEFAPPVSLVESILAAGFPRETRKLLHQMRTAPPLALSTLLAMDRQE